MLIASEKRIKVGTRPRERWRKEFGEWYNDVLIKAEIYDHRYPAKGMGVWRGYGKKIANRVYGILKKMLNENGYEEVQFPALIPEKIFRIESEHVRGFEAEVFWVTRGGLTELEEKYVLRPTSETPMYYMFRIWINSYRDLPVKIYQIVNVWRYETKWTRPLFREREISVFFEAHGAFASKEENENEVKLATKIYATFFRKLGIPFIITERPEWDKFPGAEKTYAFDTLMPNGRALQIGTVHNLGQRFAKAFDIKFQDKDLKIKHVWQNCFGVSGRVVTSIIAIHGDDHGLALLPSIAPIQIVIVPIPYKGFEQAVIQKCREVYERLKNAGFSVVLDESDETPGEKFYKWELRGVPLRIEIGPTDIKEKEITITRRDTFERIRVNEEKIVDAIRELMNKVEEEMKKAAWDWFNSKLEIANSKEEVGKLLEEGYIVLTSWCGDEKCVEDITELPGVKILGALVDENLEYIKPKHGKCIFCERKAKYLVAIAKSY